MSEAEDELDLVPKRGASSVAWRWFGLYANIAEWVILQKACYKWEHDQYLFHHYEKKRAAQYESCCKGSRETNNNERPLVLVVVKKLDPMYRSTMLMR